MLTKFKKWIERRRNRSISTLRQEITKLKNKVQNKDNYISEIRNQAGENAVDYELDLEKLEEDKNLEIKHQTNRINTQVKEIVDLNIKIEQLIEERDTFEQRFKESKTSRQKDRTNSEEKINHLKGKVQAYEYKLGVFK